MEIDNSMIGDWYSLTKEEIYDLYQKFEETDDWCDEDFLDPNDPDEIAWHEYFLEKAKFMADAEYYYMKHINFKEDKKPSPELLSIFKYNSPLLNYFLNRLKEGDKKGTEIICEFQAILALQKDKTNKLVDEEKKLEPLRSALSKMGFVTRSKQNWSDGFGNKHAKKVGRIIEEYQVFLERNR